MKNKSLAGLLLPRILIFIVLAMNLQCALAYILIHCPIQRHLN